MGYECNLTCNFNELRGQDWSFKVFGRGLWNRISSLSHPSNLRCKATRLPRPRLPKREKSPLVPPAVALRVFSYKIPHRKE